VRRRIDAVRTERSDFSRNPAFSSTGNTFHIQRHRIASIMPKARHADKARTLRDLPNVGPATVADLHLLDIRTPQELIGRDPQAMYRALCEATGQRHDPCVIDVFVSIVRFMEGAPPHPWWYYTAERKTGTSSA
jgi:Pathogenicity locus